MGLQEWEVGVGLCLAACVISNVGMVVQKLSVYRHEESAKSSRSNSEASADDSEELPRGTPPSAANGGGASSLSDGLLPKEPMMVPVYRQPLWLLGFAVFLSGQLISMWALGMAPQSMLSSLGSFSLVSNSFLAPLILNEQHNSMSIYATVLLVAGSVMVVIFSHHSDQENTPEELARNLRGFPFIVMMATIVALLIGLATRAYRLRKIQQMLEPIYFGMVSALLGALSVLFAKCVSTLLHTLVATEGGSGGIGIATGTTILIFSLSALCSLMSVYFMNLGLICFKALYILPVYYSLAIVFQTITGGVFFREFSTFTVPQALGFSGGVVLTVVGVWVLTTADLATTCPEDSSEDDEASIEEEEEQQQAPVVEVVGDINEADLESGPCSTKGFSPESSALHAAWVAAQVTESLESYSRSSTLPTTVPSSYSNPNLYGLDAVTPATSPRADGLTLDLRRPRVPSYSAPITPRGSSHRLGHANTVTAGGGGTHRPGGRQRHSAATPLTPAALARRASTALQHAMFDTTPRDWLPLLDGQETGPHLAVDWQPARQRPRGYSYQPAGSTNIGLMSSTAARAAMDMSSVTLLAAQMVDCGARLDRAHTCEGLSPRCTGRTAWTQHRRSVPDGERRRRSEGGGRFYMGAENVH
ncbi:NIPA-like protein 3 [Perkinsus olseni]|uniref:NIPA-like protein 3 n=2 Tax=Perkinsus olseni TaxID=32597 RepID=A0A7J6SVM6_PEROL|nr:NIPA-like protein 3 [Perkinsus olseni]